MKVASVVKVVLLLAMVSFACFGIESAAVPDENPASYPIPQTVKDWVSGGKYIEFEGLDIFVHSSGKAPRITRTRG